MEGEPLVCRNQNRRGHKETKQGKTQKVDMNQMSDCNPMKTTAPPNPTSEGTSSTYFEDFKTRFLS
jgi:hypothetical protein